MQLISNSKVSPNEVNVVYEFQIRSGSCQNEKRTEGRARVQERTHDAYEPNGREGRKLDRVVRKEETETAQARLGENNQERVM